MATSFSIPSYFLNFVAYMSMFHVLYVHCNVKHYAYIADIACGKFFKKRDSCPVHMYSYVFDAAVGQERAKLLQDAFTFLSISCFISILRNEIMGINRTWDDVIVYVLSIALCGVSYLEYEGGLNDELKEIQEFLCAMILLSNIFSLIFCIRRCVSSFFAPA